MRVLVPIKRELSVHDFYCQLLSLLYLIDLISLIGSTSSPCCVDILGNSFLNFTTLQFLFFQLVGPLFWMFVSGIHVFSWLSGECRVPVRLLLAYLSQVLTVQLVPFMSNAQGI